ncbi:GNAT family N-acetyltransferase [uncultured Tyzzerella sp.]|uniref:GNAT family N-acetyltransferase n=1 Tax=uncultured Tyzzerella sp. TaxID=2321398 RepID=UPI002941BC35|nr:GNAT family N-acetyltransferase [uncultured Tyzzerella sp.]
MKIRQAKYEDIEKIMLIINEAKKYFADEKIFQWSEEYPNSDTIKNDIDKNVSFVVEHNKEIIATFVFIIGEDQCYKNIYEGNWITNDIYATIHRLAISNKYKRKGIAYEIIKYSEKCCVDNNIKSLRIDTHKLNVPMIKLIEKNNFIYCGIIKTEYLSDRVAYEKVFI